MNRLKELRNNKNLLQRDIATILGIAVSTYSGWETGKFEIDNCNTIKLADFFGVSVDYLIGREAEDGAIILDAKPKTELEKDLEQLTPEEQECVRSFIKGLLSNPARKKKNSQN